ncbi:MAG TPA: Ig-like domain-containing protein [Solirubrobacterales bacterium]
MAAALLLGAVASASAADFFAAPGAPNGSGCSNAEPCSLASAVERARPNTGDTVFVKPGTYTDQTEDLGLAGRITLRQGTNLVGLGPGLPRIVARNRNAATTIDGAPGARIEFLEVSGSGANVVRLKGAKAEGLVAESVAAAPLGAVACDAFNPASPGTPVNGELSNVVCLSAAEEGTALRVGTEISRGETRTVLRGVTAIATGSESFGIEVVGTGNATTQVLPVYRADIALAIARGQGRDVVALTAPATQENQFGPEVKAELTSSSFITRQTFITGRGTAAVTSPNENENLPQRAILDGFHQLENSPTVDRGRVGTDVVPALDIDRISRPVGPAVDIGADELGGPPTEVDLSCVPGEIRTDFVENCRAIVSSESAPAPIGRLLLTSEVEQSALGSPDCTLTERSPTESVCAFTYAPTIAGGHDIKAVYSSFTHERSEETLSLIVIEGIQTETRVECAPQPVQAGSRADCQVAVRELGGGRFPHSVRGTVDLQSAADGLSDPGFFTPSTCRLDGAEVEAHCEVTYTPTAPGTPPGDGSHKVIATYRSADVHLLSTGRTDIAVSAEPRPRGETATSVSCEPGLVELGTATECRAVVVDVPLGSEAPEGFVELQSNGEGTLSTNRCALQPAAGLAECRFFYVPLEEGIQSLFATYTGQLTRRASQGSTALQVIEERSLLARSETAVACDPSSVRPKQQTTCTVRVRSVSGSAPPTGTVRIGSDGSAIAPASCTLELGGTGEGTCSFDYTPRRAEGGSHRIFATYLGDDLFEASAGETVLPVGTVTAATLTCAPSPVLVKDASICRIVVSEAEGGGETSFQGGHVAADEGDVVPTGSVGFESAAPGSFSGDGICELESISETAAACELTYVPASKVPGNHVITASYEGDAEFDARAQTATVQARANPSTVNFACTPNPAPLGSLVDCVATVVSSRADTVPTGELEFRTDRGSGRFKGVCELAPVPASASQARCEVGYDPGRAGSSGAHLLEARYGGDAVHAGDDAAVTLEVDGNQPDVSIACTPDRVRNGAPSGCEVTVTDRKQPRRPVSGNVRFSSDRPGEFGNGVPACELQEREVGVASCSLGYFPARDEFGPHTVTAEYLGDPDHDRAQAAALVNLVRDTTTSARCVSGAGVLPENTLEKDQAASCTVTVIDATGDSAPGGEVRFAGAFLEFNDPQNPTCQLQPVGADRSSCEIDLRPTREGETALLPSYRGSDVHAASAGRTPLQVVDRAPTRVRLDCTPRAMAVDEPSECTVSVQSLAVPPVQPTGQVTLASDRDGAFDPAATCDLEEEAGNAAACTLTYTPHETGQHLLVGRYGGDQAHEPNEAGAVFEVTEDGGGDEGEDGEDEENGGEDDNPRTHPTTTVLECVPAGTGVREPTTCSARVTDTGASPSSPGGSVSFDSDRGDPFDPVACALEPVDEETSSCSASYEPTTAGRHQLVAAYGGDGTHEPGAPAAAGLSVSAARTDTVTSVLCVPAQLANGDSTTCTAAVTGSADAPSAPTGRVEFESTAAGFFEDPGCELPSSPRPGERTSACSVTFTSVEVLLPAREVKASFVGDANHRGSSGTTEIERISGEEAEKSPTLATLACEPTEVEVDTATDCVATIVDTGSPRRPLSGRIELAAEPAGGLSITGCATAGAVGRATCEFTLTPNVGGSRLLTATFVGDADHRGSSAEAEVFAFEQPDERSDTSTRLTCEPSEVATDSAAGCTAVVTDEGDRTAPFSGRVEFRSDQLGVFSTATCAADEATGTLTCTAAFGPLVLGLHRLEATFVGDAGHRSSSDGAEVTAVDPGGGDGGGGGDGDEEGQEGEDGTTLVCAPDALRTSQASTCTATVTDEDGAVTVPTGRVDFSTDQTGAFGSAAVCELAPAGAGSASCDVVYTPIEVGSGSHRVTAVYDGDGVHQRGVGRDRIAVTAEDPERGATATHVDCDPNPVAAGEDSTCFVRVADLSEPDPVVPTGTVEFTSNRAGLFSAAATCTLVPIPGDESAICEIAYTPVEFGSGDHKVFATYSGSAAHRPSQGVDQVAVEPEAGPPREATQTALACAADRLKAGEPTECAATVSAAAGGVPSGDVSFDSNGTGQFSAPTCALQAAAAEATCQVTYTPTAVGSGTHRVVATYAGSGTHRPSQGEDSVAVEAASGGGGGGGNGGAGSGSGNGPGVQPPKPPLAPPNTTIKKMKPKKGAKRAVAKVVKYLFISDQPGSSFQCAIDKKPFKPCKSPFKLPKLKKVGTHTLQVRAVNPQGIADPTPAVLKWRVAKARP